MCECVVCFLIKFSGGFATWCFWHAFHWTNALCGRVGPRRTDSMLSGRHTHTQPKRHNRWHSIVENKTQPPAKMCALICANTHTHTSDNTQTQHVHNKNTHKISTVIRDLFMRERTHMRARASDRATIYAMLCPSPATAHTHRNMFVFGQLSKKK